MLFADFLNYAIDQTGITKYKLAKRLGASQTTIANWLNGTSEPHKKRRAETLALFGVDECDLKEGFPKIKYIEEKKEKPAPEGEPDKQKLLNLVDTMDMPELLKLMQKVTDAIQKRGQEDETES